MDLDNLAEPIMDALKGLAYLDDEQVTGMFVRRRNLDGGLRLANPSPILAAGLARDAEFLYVLVEDAPSQEVLE